MKRDLFVTALSADDSWTVERAVLKNGFAARPIRFTIGPWSLSTQKRPLVSEVIGKTATSAFGPLHLLSEFQLLCICRRPAKIGTTSEFQPPFSGLTVRSN